MLVYQRVNQHHVNCPCFQIVAPTYAAAMLKGPPPGLSAWRPCIGGNPFVTLLQLGEIMHKLDVMYYIVMYSWLIVYIYIYHDLSRILLDCIYIYRYHYLSISKVAYDMVICNLPLGWTPKLVRWNHEPHDDSKLTFLEDVAHVFFRMARAVFYVH